MIQKILTICIPTFNRANILDITLSNIIKQDISKVEVLVSDNGSTDNTSEIVEKYGAFGIKYFSNSKNLGLTYNFIKVMELATSDYLTLLSDEDNVDIANILASIDEQTSLKLGVILGTIQTADEEIYRGYETKIRYKGFRTFYSCGFSVAYMSGIVFSRDKIDFSDLWREFNSSSSYGFLDVYPHVYIYNRIILEYDMATDRRKFITFRDKGIDYICKIGKFGYYHPQARYEQLKKNLLFLSMFSSFNFIEYKLLILKLLRGFKASVVDYTKFDEETQNYYCIDSTESVDFKTFIKDSLSDLVKTNKIMFLDIWLLVFSMIAGYFYRIVKKIYNETKLIFS